VFTRLKLTRLKKGERVTMTCKGRGCPFKRARKKVTRKAMNVLPMLHGAHLGRGALLVIRVRDTRGVEKLFRFTTGATGTLRTVRCASPPDGRVRRC
jgi:hypothetical protein